MKLREKLNENVEKIPGIGKLLTKEVGIKEIGILAIGAYMTLISALPASASDIFIGTRGPTNYQADGRVTYSNNENDIETITNQLILKYWDGDEFGREGFISIPYTIVNSPEGSEDGLGDISITFGPRWIIAKKLHCFPYGALTIPTGELGNGRYDTRFGILTTYLTLSKRFEVDGLLEYKFTGENKDGVDPLDVMPFGLAAGGRITDNIRFITGVSGLVNEDGDYLLNSRSVMRYTFPKFLIEFTGDAGIGSSNIPEGTTLGFQIRKNF